MENQFLGYFWLFLAKRKQTYISSKKRCCLSEHLNLNQPSKKMRIVSYPKLQNPERREKDRGVKQRENRE